MKLLPLVVLTLLAACGVAGAPERPAAKAPAAGITVTGDARAGIIGTM